MSLRQAIRTVPDYGLRLAVGVGKYLGAVFVGLGVLLAGFVHTFFGYVMGQLCTLLGLLMLWSQGRTNGPSGLNALSRRPIERSRRTDSLQAVGNAAPVLIYLGAAIMGLVRANLALDARQMQRALRHARRA